MVLTMTCESKKLIVYYKWSTGKERMWKTPTAIHISHAYFTRGGTLRHSEEMFIYGSHSRKVFN